MAVSRYATLEGAQEDGSRLSASLRGNSTSPIQNEDMATSRYATLDGAQEEGRRLSASMKSHSTSPLQNDVTKTYKRRWLMLAIFVLCTIADAIHWLQYAIIAKAVGKFYNVSTLVIDLAGVSFSLTFIAFVFPAVWMIERYGLRWMLILGDLFMIIGSFMKLASMRPKLFYCGFAGQILIGIAQVFIVNVTSYLAGSWFPSNEVSTACAIGVLGTQIGVALGFFIPPLIVHDESDVVQLEKEFCWLYAAYTALPIIALPLLVIFFRSIPPIPPSLARAAPSPHANDSLIIIFKALMRIKNYNLMLVSYSLSVATFYCVSILLDQLIAIHYSKDHNLAGISGTILIIFGVCGCLGCGWFMDKTHKFKLIAVVMYIFSLVGLVLFWVALFMKWYYAVLGSAVIMGFFMVSYVIVAIEFSSEVTYPINETVSTSVLLMFGEVASVILIYVSAELMEHYGDVPVICTTGGFLAAGMIVTCCFTDVNLKRYQASIGINLHHTRPSPVPASARTQTKA